MVVDLPAPLGPRKPSTSPLSTRKSMPATAAIRPKFLVKPSISIMVDRAQTETGAKPAKRCSHKKIAERLQVGRPASAITDDLLRFAAPTQSGLPNTQKSGPRK